MGSPGYGQEIADKPGQAKTQDDLENVFRKPAKGYMFHEDPGLYCRKPMGFSWFPYELGPVPKSWISTTGELVWFRYHDKVRCHCTYFTARASADVEGTGWPFCCPGAAGVASRRCGGFLEASVGVEGLAVSIYHRTGGPGFALSDGRMQTPSFTSTSWLRETALCAVGREYCCGGRNG